MYQFRKKYLVLTSCSHFRENITTEIKKRVIRFDFLLKKFDYWVIIKYLQLKGLRGGEIYDYIDSTLYDACPSATVKNYTASFKRKIVYSK